MTTVNPFDILGDDETDDPTKLVASLKPKIVPPKIVQAPSNASAVPNQDVKEVTGDFRGGRGTRVTENLHGGEKFRGGENLRGGESFRGTENARGGGNYRRGGNFRGGGNYRGGDNPRGVDNTHGADNFPGGDNFHGGDNFRGGDKFRGGDNIRGGDNYRSGDNFRGGDNFHGSDNFRGDGQGGGRGYGPGGGRAGRGRGIGAPNRDISNNENTLEGDNNELLHDGQSNGVFESAKTSERRNYGSIRGGSRGGAQSGFNYGENGETERTRRPFERRSGTGRGNEFKREGAGSGNWGTPTEEIAQWDVSASVTENEKSLISENSVVAEEVADVNKEKTVAVQDEKEAEEKEMTLDEYEKVLEEKRKAFEALKTEERTVDFDKDFESMQQLRKSSEDVFVKLSSKEKQKEISERNEKAKKHVHIDEFLKPADGERAYGGPGRVRGRGRAQRSGYTGTTDNNGAILASEPAMAPAPSIEDHGEFPSLKGGK